jgi:S-adenosyl-L-methionine hydrolase (adenosine-forming)
MSIPLIALLTDFGYQDFYAGILKGVIHSISPEASFIDLTHGIPRGNIRAASFSLRHSYKYFPPHTIFLCIVDPGVGGARRPIIVSTEQHLFVGPDNGIFSGVYDNEESFTVYEITSDHYFRKPVSRTFHGRDVFAPVTAWLARNIELWKFGDIIRDPVRLEKVQLRRLAEREFHGTILYMDGYGNLISNFPAVDVEKVAGQGSIPVSFYFKDQNKISFCLSYDQGPEGAVFALSGSSGLIEFAVRNGSAASLSDCRPGDPVRLVFG